MNALSFFTALVLQVALLSSSTEVAFASSIQEEQVRVLFVFLLLLSPRMVRRSRLAFLKKDLIHLRLMHWVFKGV